MNDAMRKVLLIIFLLPLLASCSEKEDGGRKAVDEESVCDFSPQLRKDGTLILRYCGRSLLGLKGVSASWNRNQRAPMLFGFFDFYKGGERRNAQYALSEESGKYFLTDEQGRKTEITFSKTSAGNYEISFSIPDDATPSVTAIDFEKNSPDRFWGFGEQYNFVDLDGRLVPIWTQEQGVGRSEDAVFPWEGRLGNTYFPMPYFMDPGKGMGFLLRNSEYSEFDLRMNRRFRLEVWNAKKISIVVFAGPTPKDVVAQLTAEVGRPKSVPPDWSLHGVWLAAQGGTAAVSERAALALDAGIPVSAVWVQDWVGHRNFGLGNHGVKYHWTWDEDLYPDLDELIADLRDDDVRFLGYFNPFVVPQYDQYREAVDNGYLIRRADGGVYQFLIITFFGSLPDLTNDEAAVWFENYARQAVDLGMAGWMADFGEWLPYDAILADGDARSFHNLYSSVWHGLNRKVLEDNYGEDFVLLTRSGFTGEHAVAQVVWAGDQEADWSETDGLPTVVKAGLTLGLSGIPFFTHDIAGFSGGPSTGELFRRWTELGAFTPVMRTHDGLKKDENHRFDSDEVTLAHFRRMSLLHQALFPYFKALALEAKADGLPIIRHTVLVDPDWPEAYAAHDQWMIGDDLLFAPVVHEGENWVTADFPQGVWEHLLTGEIRQGRSSEKVPAPEGTPAVYFRQGSTIEELVPQIREIYADGSASK